MTYQNDPPTQPRRTGMRDSVRDKASGSNIGMMLGLAALILVGVFFLWPRSESRDTLTQNKQLERPTPAPTTTPPATTPAPTTTPPAK